MPEMLVQYQAQTRALLYRCVQIAWTKSITDTHDGQAGVFEFLGQLRMRPSPAGDDVVTGNCFTIEVLVQKYYLAVPYLVDGAAFVNRNGVFEHLRRKRLRIGLIEPLAENVHVDDLDARGELLAVRDNSHLFSN